ncbi:MAG: FtsX-like permease family protein [Actinomycetota bacterium]|jgi:putative ABC transport system permease protein|nr:FtsX-like permease family protein [Actinomycetota bacterium]
MDTLFGVETTQLMWTLLAVFGFGAAVLLLSALRNRVAFKMAVRNIPRRPSQTALIVLGLMLATLLFSASFTTGDTLTSSLRAESLQQIGEVDVVLSAETPSNPNQFTGPAVSRDDYFDDGVVNEVRNELSGDEEVAGVAPFATETVSVVSEENDESEPRVDILGFDEASMGGFDEIVDASGNALSLGDFGGNEVYMSATAAEELGGLGEGDEVEAFFGNGPSSFEVAGIYESGANPGSETSLAMGLADLQSLVGVEGEINNVLISHAGDSLEGGERTDETVAAVEPVLESNELAAAEVKRDAIERSDEAGAQVSSIFLLFGQFSIAAGILLIFLIFVMLAAERKRELGIARGVGMQRKHVVRMFAFEGAVYAFLASVVGSLLGVGVGWVMVRIVGAAFAESGFDMVFSARPENVVIAFALGMVLTFAVVLISSWRVSRLNIVRAIRDIPEPDKKGRTVKGVLLALLTPVFGALAVWGGFEVGQMGLLLLGVSLLIIGVALVARVAGVPDRASFTFAGVGLLTLWLLPVDYLPTGLSQGIDLFFLSGIMIVVGAVWVVIYNSDILLGAIVKAFGWIRGLPPVLKTAVSYPMQARFRTGMTLAMFSLVVFTLVTMSFINKSFATIFDDTERLAGGYDIRADAGYAAPIPDIEEALAEAEGVDEEKITDIGSVNGIPTEAKQRGSEGEAESLYVQGVDEGYSESVGYGFNIVAEEYGTDREVWEALQTEENVAVVSSRLAPTRNDFDIGAPPPPVELSGFFQEDEYLPGDLFITVEEPESGESRDLRVIGVVEDSAFYAGEVTTSQSTLAELVGFPIPAQSYMFGLNDGAEAGAVASSLENGFRENGLEANPLAQEIEDGAVANDILSNLLVGFMGLGLLVGIAALGVIAARSVVERRQQIGMMRAMGFQRGQVRLAFLIESSFIALVGITLGVALGGALSGTIIGSIEQDFAGITYQVPWLTVGLIVGVAYVASLLTTFLPARSASKVYPAEALRYE